MDLFTRKNFLFQFSTVFVTVTLTSLFLLLPIERQIAESYNENILKRNANLSFQIPSPGKEQVKELEAYSEVDKVFPYYDLFTNLRLKRNKAFPNFYTMLITSSQIESFPFTQKSMIIKGINFSNDEPVAFIDYSFAKENNLKTGDNIELAIGTMNIIAVIGAIINNPGLLMHIRQGDGTAGSVIISVPDNLLSEIVEGRTIQYGGAYIRSNSYERAKNMLRNYKPMGRLRDRHLFSSQDEYQNYLNDFNKMSYAAEIRDLMNEFTRPHFPISNVLLVLLLTVLEIMLIIIINFNNLSFSGRAYEKIKNGEKVNTILFPIKLNFIIVLLSNVILYLLFFYIFILTNRVYCPGINYVLFLVLFIIFTAFLSTLCMGIYIKIYKKRLITI